MMVKFPIVMYLRMMIMLCLLLLMMLRRLMILKCMDTIRTERSFENFTPIFLRESIVVCVVIIATDCRGNHFRQWRHGNFVITLNAQRTPMMMLLFISFTSSTTSSKALCEKFMKKSLIEINLASLTFDVIMSCEMLRKCAFKSQYRNGFQKPLLSANHVMIKSSAGGT